MDLEICSVYHSWIGRFIWGGPMQITELYFSVKTILSVPHRIFIHFRHNNGIYFVVPKHASRIGKRQRIERVHTQQKCPFILIGQCTVAGIQHAYDLRTDCGRNRDMWFYYAYHDIREKLPKINIVTRKKKERARARSKRRKTKRDRNKRPKERDKVELFAKAKCHSDRAKYKSIVFQLRNW